MGALKEVPKPGLVKSETRDQIQARNRDAAKELWAGKLTRIEQAAVNAVCEAYGLDPLLKHILVLGGNLYITVAGLRAWAYKQDEADRPVSIQVIPVGNDDRETSGVPSGAHYWMAKVWKRDTPADRPYIEYGESDKDNVSLHRAGWKEIQDMAKTRAVGRTLRNAYSVSLPLAEDMPMFPWDQALDVTVAPPETIYQKTESKEPLEPITQTPLEAAIVHIQTIVAIPHLSNYWNAHTEERKHWTGQEQSEFKMVFEKRMAELRESKK